MSSHRTRTTLTALSAGILLALTACGSDDPGAAGSPSVAAPVAATNAPDPGGAAAPIGEDVSFELGIAADQLVKQFEATGYRYDATTSGLTFAFTSGMTDDSFLSHCQIGTSVMESIAPGAVKVFLLETPDGTRDCAELLD